MARVLYSGIVTELVGNLGGTTFQKNKSGYIARNLGHCRKKSTFNQSVQQVKFYAQMAGYMALSVSYKTTWVDLATAHPIIDKFGNEKTLNGCNWYTSINSFLVAMGQSVLSAAPTYTLPSTVWTASGYWHSSGIYLGMNISSYNSDTRFFLYTTQAIKGQSISYSRFLRLTYIFDCDHTQDINVVTEWEAAHGQSYQGDDIGFNNG
ncbi:MAG TPA: hypothetical protein PKV52_04890, partial [Candidatus Saccharibacteria bacterium]|nr:hypothetical protein [Candidatus Saccharibacteria bacterium]